jgi:diguanylate cyclase (GGDEF)-like protein
LLLGIAYFSLDWLKAGPPAVRAFIQYAPYLLFIAAMFFGWRFNRSRVFFCSLTLALSQLALLDFVPEGMNKNDYYDMMKSLVSIYIPLNILAFSVQKERGVVSSWGRMRMLLITIEALIAAWIVWYHDIDLLQLFEMKLLTRDIKLLPDFPQLSLLLFLAALAYLFTREAVAGKNNDSPFVGVTVYSFAALLFADDPFAAPLMLALSGLLLVAVVIQASYSMAYLDELTGLPSRRALKEELLKLGGKYTIAMLDIDHFKKFNDTHGHDVGDDVLKLVATCIRNVGGGGKPFRYGGEEFTIVFPGKAVEEAVPYLEELRGYIADRGFIKRSKSRPEKKPADIVTKRSAYKKLYLTVSIGVAEKNERHKNAEEVITASDKALYRAKSKGRNCLCK